MKMPRMAGDALNLFEILPAPGAGEEFRDLANRDGVRIERIVSRGDVTPEGFWYDQAWHEWVLVVEGEAELALEAPNEVITLRRGDSFLIEAHRRHRVTRTGDPTIWLAVHWPAAN